MVSIKLKVFKNKKNNQSIVFLPKKSLKLINLKRDPKFLKLDKDSFL